jgi:hypothetical protein
MKRRSKLNVRRLRPVVVRAGAVMHMGLLLFETNKFIVLLNNMVEGADVGPLRSVRTEQFEPECDVLVLPRSAGMTMEFLRD